jgi:hypothetical protein
MALPYFTCIALDPDFFGVTTVSVLFISFLFRQEYRLNSAHSNTSKLGRFKVYEIALIITTKDKLDDRL